MSQGGVELLAIFRGKGRDFVLLFLEKVLIVPASVFEDFKLGQGLAIGVIGLMQSGLR